MGCFVAREDVAKRLSLFFQDRVISIPMDFDSHNPIGNHPDVHMAKVGERWIVSPQMGRYLMRIKAPFDFAIGQENPEHPYPKDVLYNVATFKSVFLGLRPDATIDEWVTLNGFNRPKVRQGYVKCNLLMLDEETIITEDSNLYKVISEWVSNPILIQVGYIELRGYPYGFIGGASGVKNNVVIFNGSLAHHPDQKIIESSLIAAGFSSFELHEGPLEDAGSIFYIEESKVL